MADLTDITFLLDCSGSMHRIRDEVAAGYEEFIADRRNEPGECVVSLYRFSDRCEQVYAALPLAEVPPLDLHPFGNTALRDAIAQVIHATRERLARAVEQPACVIVGIITDGHDNRSRGYTPAAISSLIEAQESIDGWEFYYLGANQDAIEVGAELGVGADRSLTYAPAKAATATKALSDAIGRSREARTAPRGSAPGFTESERAAVD